MGIRMTLIVKLIFAISNQIKLNWINGMENFVNSFGSAKYITCFDHAKFHIGTNMYIDFWIIFCGPNAKVPITIIPLDSCIFTSKWHWSTFSTQFLHQMAKNELCKNGDIFWQKKFAIMNYIIAKNLKWPLKKNYYRTLNHNNWSRYECSLYYTFCSV